MENGTLSGGCLSQQIEITDASQYFCILLDLLRVPFTHVFLNRN